MSLLMDMSFGQLGYVSPQKVHRKPPVEKQETALDLLSEDLDLSALSTDELERLAWEANEKESELRKQYRRDSRTRTSFRIPDKLQDPMRNITVRSPRRSPRRTVSPEKLQEHTSSGGGDHAIGKRKSVTFGRVEEYEISHKSDSVELETVPCKSNKDVFSDPAPSLPSHTSMAEVKCMHVPAKKHAVRSENTNTLVDPSKQSAVRQAPAKSDVRQAKRRYSRDSPLSVPRPSKSPLARTRQQVAVQESAARERAKVRQSIVSAQRSASPSSSSAAPNGYRISSTGTLVNRTAPKSPAITKSRLRGTAQTQCSKDRVPRANPVPEWLKRRKEELARQEEERLEQERERIRALELSKSTAERVPSNTTVRKSTASKQAGQGFVSAVERRMAERAEWEMRRRTREAVLEREREQARQEREEYEEQAYKRDRQRTVVHANPVPDWLHTTLR